MKTLLLTAVLLTSASVFAALDPQCASQAVKAAVAKNYKNFRAGTNSCGIKALNISSELETYLVCTSDETDPMEYVVAIKPSAENKKTKVMESCVLKMAEISSDSETPNFESEDGLIKTANECMIDFGDKEVVCK